MPRVSPLLAILSAATLVLAGCGSSEADDVLTISAIPDQDPQQLQRTYGVLSDYLTERLGVEVEYSPVADYTASVNLFQRGDLELVFFGGVTGVQARTKVPDAVTIAQRDIDEKFHSVFVASADSGVKPLKSVDDLSAIAGHSLTFGDKISTSGRVMPQHFLAQAGVALSDLKGEPGFSGSHDKTAKLVESGTYEVGAMSASVWDDRLAAGTIDKAKVTEIFRTPAYHDYHWLARPNLDETFGDGFTGKLRDTLLAMDGDTAQEREILALFQAGSFIATEPGNYTEIEAVAKQSGLIR